MQISSGKGTQSALGGERVDGIHGKQAGTEAVEPTAPLDEVFPESALGLCPERGPILPEGMGQSSWESRSCPVARAGSPCRGGDSSPASGSPAKARAGTGAGGGGCSH